MTIEDQITALLSEAEPLRALSEDDPAKEPLGAIVDEINRLRAIQAGETVRNVVELDVDPLAPKLEDKDAPLPVRRPGRPRKVN